MQACRIREGLDSLTDLRLDRYGGIQPLGSHIADTHIDGVKWHVWNGSQPIMGTEQQTYTFLAAKPQHNFNGDVKDFFNYLAKTYAYPAESQYLISKSVLGSAIVLLTNGSSSQQCNSGLSLSAELDS